MNDLITKGGFGHIHHRSSGIFLARMARLGVGLLVLLAACSPKVPAATSAPATLPAPVEQATPVPSPTTTPVPVTISATPTLPPSPTPTPPYSAVVTQALKDAFSCLANNLTYAPNINLTNFCPGYWSSSSSNINSLDGFVIRKGLVPYLASMDNIRWKLDGVSDVQKDERLSSTLNPIYTATLSTILSADATLKCPSGTPAPFQTKVSIPIKGVARIAVYDYANQAQEYIRIESWSIQGNPLQDYCATLH